MLGITERRRTIMAFRQDHAPPDALEKASRPIKALTPAHHLRAQLRATADVQRSSWGVPALLRDPRRGHEYNPRHMIRSPTPGGQYRARWWRRRRRAALRWSPISKPSPAPSSWPRTACWCWQGNEDHAVGDHTPFTGSEPAGRRAEKLFVCRQASAALTRPAEAAREGARHAHPGGAPNP